MSNSTNPFARGFRNFRIERTLCIVHADDCPPVWRPLHESQAHLPDEQVALFPCIFNNDVALVTEGQTVPAELDAQCPSDGDIRLVAYGVMAEDFDGNPVHVGDVYSAEAARELVHRLRFQSGFYSRCWEISDVHLTRAARRYLSELVRKAAPSLSLIDTFPISDGVAVGVKLCSTPWRDANLQPVIDMKSEALRQEHRDHGLPESLLEVLHLAGQADVRMLVFDPDAPLLDGLKRYCE